MFPSFNSKLFPPILVLGGILFAYAGFEGNQEAKALADHGKTAMATVDMVQWKEKRLTGREKSFKLDVHFETEDKQTIQTKLSVSKDMGQRFRDTDAGGLEIKYLPEKPSTVALAGSSSDAGAMLALMGVGIAAAVAGAGLFAYRMRKTAAA